MKNTTICILLLFSIFVFAQTNQTSKQFQDDLNFEYADKTKSPLTEADFEVFKSLDFFEIDTKFIVQAKFKKSKKEKVFEMKTTTNRLPKYIKYGEIEFEINNKIYKLNVYQNLDLIKNQTYQDYLFLPFLDLTNGNQSYVGGRYIDLKIPNNNTIEIDFNKAYNPYCAYSDRYSCPIVPVVNNLQIAILAGVKKFHD